MTYTEAKKEIDPRIDTRIRLALKYDLEVPDYIEALEMASQALNRQIPMKPVLLKYEPLILHGWEYGCPACEKAVGFNKYAVEYTDEDPFCPSCGQKLDWEE